MTHNPYIGCLLGTAVGDSLGLPYEGLSARRARKLFPDATARSILKLWLGFSPQKSGVFSAGNGPAMREWVNRAFRKRG
jgi:ADP-ribosylglycohydrolase